MTIGPGSRKDGGVLLHQTCPTHSRRPAHSEKAAVTFRQLPAEQIIEVAKAAGLQVPERRGDVHVQAFNTRRAINHRKR